jgi:hypothetical protein
LFSNIWPLRFLVGEFDNILLTGKQRMLQMKNEKEEMENDLMRKLQAADIVILRKGTLLGLIG